MRMGNDCAGALDWAWLAISPVDVFQGGAAPRSTHYLIPTSGVQKQYGIYPVGQMKGDTFDGEDAAYEVVSKTDSQEFVNLNGDAVICEAYAMSRKADAVIFRTDSGHVRMLAVDPVVIRNADGSVDAKQSYMITHEQGDGLFDRRDRGTNSSWRLNYRYTFDILLHGSSKENAKERTAEAGSGVAYIPITIRALREETVLTPTINVYPAAGNSEITSPESGSFSSAYRITSTHLVIKDVSGNIVKDETCHNSHTNGDKKITLALQYDGITKDLAPGQYTFTITAALSDGSVHTVAEDLAFEKK